MTRAAKLFSSKSFINKISSRAAIGLILSFLLPLLIFASINVFSAPPPLISIEAESQFVAYRVVRPKISVILLENATTRDSLSNCPYIEGTEISLALLEPASASNVQYRYAGNELSILVSREQEGPSSFLRFKNDEKCELPMTATFVLKDPENSSISSRPLPIDGPGVIGTQVTPPTLPSSEKTVPHQRLYTLIGGEIRVFGRTASPIDKGTLYPAQDAVYPLPTGGKLSSGDDPMYGVAILKDKLMKISVTTESVDLKLHRPGRSSDSEKYGISFLVRIFNDPSIAPLSLYIFFVSVAMQAIFGWIDSWKKNDAK